MRRGASALWGAVMALGFVRCAVDDSGSQTHWLGACGKDRVCPDGLTCECGRCARRCEAPAACEGLGRSATCAAADAVLAWCGGSGPSVCLPTCEAGCRTGERCVAGACVAAPTSGDPDCSKYVPWGLGGSLLVSFATFCSGEPCPPSLAEFEAEWDCQSGDGGAMEPPPRTYVASRTEGCNRVTFETQIGNPRLLYVFDLTTGEYIGAGREDDINERLGDYSCVYPSYVAGEWDVACESVTTQVCHGSWPPGGGL